MSACGIIVLHVTPQRVRSEAATVAAEIRSALAAGRGRPRLAVRTLPAVG